MTDVLKEALKDDKDESSRSFGSSEIDVQFAKVWGARGCAILLNEDEKLFGGKN